jgi:hypothetical protein
MHQSRHRAHEARLLYAQQPTPLNRDRLYRAVIDTDRQRVAGP